MIKSKPSCPPEGIELKIQTNGNKEQDSKPKKYTGNKPQNIPSSDPKTDTDFQGRCTDLEGYTSDMQHIHQQKIPLKYQKCSRWTIFMSPL